MNVGFLGLGAMGSAMALRVLKAGHKVSAWNRSPKSVQELVAEGATAAKTPQEAFQADVIITMLADDDVDAAGAEGGWKATCMVIGDGPCERTPGELCTQRARAWLAPGGGAPKWLEKATIKAVTLPLSQQQTFQRSQHWNCGGE